MMADEEHLVRGEHEDQNIEPMRPAVQRGQTYLYFRSGRRPQLVNTSTRIILMIFKVMFCSLGLWSYRPWNYVPRLLFVIICAAQVSYQLSIDLKCPFFSCNFYEKLCNITPTTDFLEIQKAGFSLFSLAALLSYVVFIKSVTTSRGKDSALVSPSESMNEDSEETAIKWLFIGFIGFVSAFFTALPLFFYCEVHNHDYSDNTLYIAYISTPAVLTPLAHWASVNTCHAFAVSSSCLGTIAEDTLRLIRDIENGTLDDVIRIHEDLCTVVLNTVSAYRVWFVLHWFTYGAGVIVFFIYISEELSGDKNDIPCVCKIYICAAFVCSFYMFMLPCVYAARITNACAGVYDRINCTTSDDWNEGHPFKDRRNMFLFISYARNRGCGFKVGRIRFNSSLAWFSFFFGLLGLLYHFV